jgi:hypothetical protein
MADRLPFHELQRRFAARIRDPEHAPLPDGIEPRRMKVYEDLFFNNLSGLLAGAFPVLHAIYGDARWAALVRDFMVRHRAHTPLFPEVAQELLAFLAGPRAGHPDDPPFAHELAHYEWVELALQLDPATTHDPRVDPAGDPLSGAPAVSPLAWTLAYDWPVHTLSATHQPSAPPAAPTLLVVWRDAADDVRFMSVSPATARWLELAGADGARASGRELLEQVAAEQGLDPTRAAAAGREALALLKREGILLGTRR